MKKEIVLNMESKVITIHADDNDVNINDIWEGAGRPKNKDPREWLRFAATVQLIDTVANMLNVGNTHIIRTKKGKHGGTWAHKQIALAYAKYLDPKLHVMVNEVFFERIEEEKNPDLIAERYKKTYQKRGKTNKWIQSRFKGIEIRNEYTDTLSKHKVVKQGYKNCTNAIYEPIIGDKADVIRVQRGLPEKANLRDNVDETELVAIMLAEQLATQDIEEKNVNGNKACEDVSRLAATAIANAIKLFKTR